MWLQRKSLVQAHGGHEGLPTIQSMAYAKYVISGLVFLQSPSQPRKTPLCYAAVFKRRFPSSLL